MKNFIVYLFLLMMSITVNSQSLDDKRDSYDKEKTRIEKLEKDVGYSGDDEFIRQRNNLPPKLPPFEEGVEKNSPRNIETKQDPSNFQQPENINKAINDTSSKKQGGSSGSKPISVLITLCLIPLVYLLINFIFYKRTKFTRRFFIAPPFGIGDDKTKNTDSNADTKKRRLLWEFGIFCAAVFVMFSSLFIDVNWEQTILTSLIDGVGFAVFGHIIFIGGRFFAEYKTRCPKCKATYAAKLVNSYKEPKTNYIEGGDGKPRYSVEQGLNHENYICEVCSHEWHIAKPYTTKTTT